jgi:hypothetical protein
MSKGIILSLLFLSLPLRTMLLSAHEGHEHNVMGKVLAVDDKRIEIETTEGKRVTGVLSAQTKYSRDKAPATRTDVKVGERVVIVVVEDASKVQNVKHVRLGPAPNH